jgi:hypothetical protein
MLGKLAELDSRNVSYYFQFTLCGYGPPIEEHNPPRATAVDAFQRLASRLGPDKVIWRYDPIILSEQTGVEFHLKNFEVIASTLKGFTQRCVISLWDKYRKLAGRLANLASRGIHFRHPRGEELDQLIPRLVQICAGNGMEIVSCAEEVDLLRYGVRKGKCIDDELIARLFGVEVCRKKDASQRPACGCVQSRDIGVYNSCLFGCSYCYATTSFDTAVVNHSRHDSESSSLFS